jgi:tetratricopeptide (TPR) repeat protein
LRRVSILVARTCALLVVLTTAALASASAQTPDLPALSKQGNDAMAAGQYAEAVKIYAELARALPDDAGILMNLGMAQSMAGRPRDAIAPLERAVKLQPSLHPAWLFLGTAHLELHKPVSAVAPLEKAVATDPRSIKARQMLGEAYLMLERYDEAGKQLEKLTELDPGSAPAWYGLGQSHEARARIAFERLQKLGTGSPYESLLVGDALASEEKYSEAVERYRAALAKVPRMAAAHEALAEIYDQAGNSGGAAAERKIVDSLPAPDCAREKAVCEFVESRFSKVIDAVAGRNDPESLYWRARAHNELAVEAFSTLEQLPPSAESHAFRAQLYRNQGRHVESATELERAAKLAPENRGIQKELATALYLSRNYDAAEPILQELLEQEPSSAQLKFLYGDTLLQSQKAEKAVPLLESAVAADASFLEARVSLARAYLLVGRPADAIPHLKAALETDDDGSLHYQLARAYQATGQTALAKQMMAKYEEMQKARRK